jgi:RimJ/RimL family protein N-acetyltransferase
MDEIITKRLYWRPPCPDDIDGYMGFVGDYEVVKWTATWPHPADRDVVASRCVPLDAARGFAGPVFLGETQIGGMGIVDGELGYFFARRHWGKGFASEMGRSMVARAFHRYDWPEITACVIRGNGASVRVLEKLGFEHTGRSRCASVAQRKTFDADTYALTRANWLVANPLRIETPRLVIRAIDPGDLTAFHAIASRKEVATMMQSIAHPLSRDQARAWVEERRYQGRPGFCPGVYLKDGPLIGALGIGGDPVTVASFLDPARWGRGYATEAMRAFLADAQARFGVGVVEAGALHDNIASQRVLQKLGFLKTGEKEHQPAERLEPERLFLYRLSLTNEKAAS